MALATDPRDPLARPAAAVRTPGGGLCRRNIKHFDWRIIFRLRSLLYMGRLVSGGHRIWWWPLLSRDRLEVNVLHDRNPQYVLESNGDIRNGYFGQDIEHDRSNRG